MINSKLLAVKRITEFEPGSNEYFMAITCHLDAGDDLHDISLLLRKTVQVVAKMAEKGRVIRDRLIKEQSVEMMKAVYAEEIPAPRICRNIVVTRGPSQGIATTRFLTPPRGLRLPESSTMH